MIIIPYRTFWIEGYLTFDSESTSLMKLLTPDFGKSNVIRIMKQSAICVDMKAGNQKLLSRKPEACLLAIHT